MKRWLSIRALLPAVTGLMTLVLTVVFAIYAYEALQRREEVRRVPFYIDVSYDLFAAIQDIRVERGSVNRALAAPATAPKAVIDDIVMARKSSVASLDSGLRKLGNPEVNGFKAEYAEIESARVAFDDLRGQVDVALTQTSGARSKKLPQDWLDGNARFVRAIDQLASRLEGELRRGDPFVGEMIRVKQIVWPVRSDSGDDRLLVRQALVDGRQITPELRHDLDILAGHIEGLWMLVQEEGELASTPPRLKTAIDEADKLYYTDFRNLRNEVVEDLTAGRKPKADLDKWLELSGPGRTSLYAVAKTAFDLATEHAIEQFAVAERDFGGALALMFLFLGMGALTAYYVIYRVVRPITQMAHAMSLVADGNLTGKIPFEGRADEIGLLSRSLRIFRDNAIEKQQLNFEKAGAEAANRTKSEFLAHVSHELRTPLNAIIGFSEVIKLAMFGPLSQRYRGYGADIFNSGTHLLNLINDILDLTKLEAGKFELHEEEFDLSAMIDSTIHLMEPQSKKGKVKVAKAIDEGTQFLRADERRIRQVLINLLSNAVKFTLEGGTVLVTTAMGSKGLVISVRDTGIGMSPDQIPLAQQPFRQIDSKISRKHEGTGLGLPLAKHLAELHGGTLTIESKLNLGTTVSITLPADRVAKMQRAS